MDTTTKLIIPNKYTDYIYIFSKAESNILLLYCPYNYKIYLEADSKKALKYNPLYKISLEELETVKEYLVENLSKGFIKFS
jgi:hypothetical protein